MSGKDDRDNRANQLNPNNPSYHSSRGAGHSDYDDDDEPPGPVLVSHRSPPQAPRYFKMVCTTRGEIVEKVFTYNGFPGIDDPLFNYALQKGKSWCGKSPETLMGEHPDWVCVSFVKAGDSYSGQVSGQLMGHFNGSVSWSAPLASFLLRLAPHVTSYWKLDRLRLLSRDDPKYDASSLREERALLRRRLRYGIRHIDGFLPWLESHVHPQALVALRNCSDLKGQVDVVLNYRDNLGLLDILRYCEGAIDRIAHQLRANLEYHAHSKAIAIRLNEYLELKGLPPIASKLLVERYEYSK